MGVNSFAVVSGAQALAGGDSTAKHEPGTIMAYRSVTDQWALVEYVQLDNNGVSQGEALIVNYATLKQYSVAKPGTGDGFQPYFAGLALTTIASQKFGWMVIQGYCEKADLSHTAASGEMLTMSASTAAKLTPNLASSVWNATIGTVTNATLPWPVAVARTAIATGVGSVSLIGCWGV